MSEIKFSKNYSDHSVTSGPNAGFQFEFNCERCGDAWRTDFVPYRGGQASSWIGRAAGIFGGLVSEASTAAEGLAQAGYGKAHDQAFATSIEQAKSHFHRCARCFKYVCEACWNSKNGLCRECSPDAEIEIESARAAGELAAAADKATQEGKSRGAKLDVQRDRQLTCPQCKAKRMAPSFARNVDSNWRC